MLYSLGIGSLNKTRKENKIKNENKHTKRPPNADPWFPFDLGGGGGVCNLLPYNDGIPLPEFSKRVILKVLEGPIVFELQEWMVSSLTCGNACCVTSKNIIAQFVQAVFDVAAAILGRGRG